MELPITRSNAILVEKIFRFIIIKNRISTNLSTTDSKPSYCVCYNGGMALLSVTIYPNGNFFDGEEGYEIYLSASPDIPNRKHSDIQKQLEDLLNRLETVQNQWEEKWK